MPDATPQRIGLFGGSFDPIHNGHLIMAQDACEHLNLDRIYFIPAGEAPLRSNKPHSLAEDRFAMVEAAITDNPSFEASDVDIKREGISYSIHTVNDFSKTHPEAHLFWIAGADQAAQLGDWRRIDDIAKRVDFIFLQRDGNSFENIQLPSNIRHHLAPTHNFDVSSSEIRQRLKEGLSANYFLPATVLDYIKSRNLYQ
ncbi:MAG: nicotinate-nucleotide adenylyltransferase [Verrucomicrobiota bacterium]